MPLRTSFVSLLIAVLFLGTSALAHSPGLSRATLREGPGELSLFLRFDAADWRALEARPAGGIRLASEGRTLSPLWPARITREGEHVDVVLAFPTAAGRLRFAFDGFPALAHGHRQYVERRNAEGTRTADAVLQESAPAVWLD